MANWHMKKCSSPSSGKYKSKPQWDTTSYLSEWLTLTTQATIDVVMDAEKEDLFCIVGGNVNWYSHSGKQYGSSSKIKNRTTLQPSNCTTRFLSKGYSCAVSKGHMHPNIYSSTINNRKIMVKAQMSIDWWIIKKIRYIYTKECYSTI